MAKWAWDTEAKLKAWSVGGGEFDHRPGHYRTSFLSNQATGTVFSSDDPFFPNSEFM